VTRANIVSLVILIAAVPAATASSFLASNAKPCLITGSVGYEISGSATATHTVRIDNNAPHPSLRIQVVNDPAVADFVLVDDGDADNTCTRTALVESIRIDPTATKPELTVSLSRASADYKIFVRSVNYTVQDAAALFAVIWQNASETGSLRTFAKHD
jgi:hypothetical protein